MGPMPRFVCDAMLGSLARWLRFYGFDALFLEGTDEELLEVSRREERWLVTRDGALAAHGPRSVCLRAATLDDQLRELFARLDLHPEPTLERARCSACNGELESVPAEEAVTNVPPFVGRTVDRFRRCTSCGRIYWAGSHTGRIVDRMRRICSEPDTGKEAAE